jgi:hypothetical protein
MRRVIEGLYVRRDFYLSSPSLRKLFVCQVFGCRVCSRNPIWSKKGLRQLSFDTHCHILIILNFRIAFEITDVKCCAILLFRVLSVYEGKHRLRSSNFPKSPLSTVKRGRFLPTPQAAQFINWREQRAIFRFRKRLPKQKPPGEFGWLYCIKMLCHRIHAVYGGGGARAVIFK